MNDAQLVKLIRWDAEDVRAVLDQVQHRVEDALRDGKMVGIVAVVVTADLDGANKTYEPAFSRMPMECALWATNKMRRRIDEIAEES